MIRDDLLEPPKDAFLLIYCHADAGILHLSRGRTSLRSEPKRDGLARPEFERIGQQVLDDLLHCKRITHGANSVLDIVLKHATPMSRLGFVSLSHRQDEVGKVRGDRLQ